MRIEVSKKLPETSEFSDYGPAQLLFVGLLVLLLFSLTRGFAMNYTEPAPVIQYLHPNRLLLFPLLFVLALVVIWSIESIAHAKHFRIGKSKHIHVRGLVKSVVKGHNPLHGITLSVLMATGVVGAAHLSEVYRLTAHTWYDAQLWSIESTLIQKLLASRINDPALWDKIYFLLWPYLFLIMAFMFRKIRSREFIALILTVMFSFYITRFINLQFPSAGPAFFVPELFHLGGTITGAAQDHLRLFMQGAVQQNGLTPGTMAMPSLHVGLAMIAVLFCFRLSKKSLWVTLPALALTWLATVVLGWHYFLDGVGAIFVVFAAHRLALLMLAIQEKLTSRFWGARRG
jgi:hypothetical protein